MKRLLQLGFILGLAGTIAAAWFAPIFEYTRYRSATSVIANGGRVEQFQVHLPVDRLDSSGLTVMPGDPSTRLQHFKLRDAEGNVIGLVARHRIAIGEAVETAWLLTIPSRGSIALGAAGGGSVESLVAARGLSAGQSLDQPLSFDSPTPATSVTATGEFSGIDFELIESWVVTGLDENGEILGTLRLNTLGRQST
jgi:hypothetical protein